MKKYRLLQKKPEKIVSEYHQLLYQRDEYNQYQTEKGVITGKIIGVDEFGRLLIVEDGFEPVPYDLKEVKFL